MGEGQVISQLDVIVEALRLIITGGFGAAIVACVGKRFVDKKLAEQQANYAEKLEAVRAELDIYKEKHLKGHTDKIEIYRLVVNLLAEILGDLDYLRGGTQPLPDGANEAIRSRVDKFNRNRMKAYGYLAMMAPQNIMDAYDSLIDYLLEVICEGKEYKWPMVRKYALNLINEARKDVGIDSSSIEYRGAR